MIKVNFESNKILVKYFPEHYGHDIRVPPEKPVKPKRKYTKRRRKNVEEEKELLTLNSTNERESVEVIDGSEINNDSTFSPENIKTIKNNIVTTLWKITCDVEKCNSKEVLMELYSCLNEVRRCIPVNSS